MVDEESYEKTELAKERTLLAGERTLMAWIRTAFSMITFGFSLVKFFQYLTEAQHETAPLHGPRNLGLALIGLGIFGLTAATGEFISIHRRLYPGKPLFVLFRSYPVIMAILFDILGILAFLAILLRSRVFG